MSKRTNEIYNVTVAMYASMAVEASSPQEAMKIAKKWKDEYVTEEDFEDSDIEVESCDSYPSEKDDYEDEEYIYCEDDVMKAEDYYRELEEQ